MHINSLLPSPDLSSVSQKQKLIGPDENLSTFESVVKLKCQWEGGKICDSYQQLSLQHQPQVGGDWLERRLDVTPWTGRWAQNGEVRKVTNMWSTPACLLSRCVGCVQGRTANNSLCGLAPRLIIDLIFIYIITLVNVIHFIFNPKFDFYLSVCVAAWWRQRENRLDRFAFTPDLLLESGAVWEGKGSTWLDRCIPSRFIDSLISRDQAVRFPARMSSTLLRCTVSRPLNGCSSK